VYGSKTNTAQGYAKQLHEEAEILGINSTLKDCEDFTKEELKSDSLKIFLMATDGEGEPTDNAVPFHQLVKKNAKEGNKIMTGDYIVFGLGDSSYEHFNAMGRFFTNKLQKLGGNFVYEYGETDAQKEEEADEDFITWKEKLWPALIEKYDDGKGARAAGAAGGLPFTAVVGGAPTQAAAYDMLYRQY
jgi:NADPH-ferrihemoprotein reductase